jgi:hypothetical protein
MSGRSKNVLARLIDTALQNFIAMLYNVPQIKIIPDFFRFFQSFEAMIW